MSGAQRILSLDEYFAQHGGDLGFPEPLESGRKGFEANLNSARTTLQSGEIMTALISTLRNVAEDYSGGRPQLLYYQAPPTELDIKRKPYISAINKIYRHNYLRDDRFPEEPSDAPFVLYSTLYDHPKMNDLLRSRIVCKYMDGPQAVISGLIPCPGD